MITIYHNPRCRKSREGLEIVEQSGLPYQVVEYLKHPLNEAGIKDLLHKLGPDAQSLIRKNEALWKEQFRGRDLSDTDLISALAAHPILMERPVVVCGEQAVIGRPPSKISELLAKA